MIFVIDPILVNLCKIYCELEVNSFISSFIHSFTRSFVLLFNSLFIHSFIHSFIHLFIHSFIHLFIHSFIHSFHQWPCCAPSSQPNRSPPQILKLNSKFSTLSNWDPYFHLPLIVQLDSIQSYIKLVNVIERWTIVLSNTSGRSSSTSLWCNPCN